MEEIKDERALVKNLKTLFEEIKLSSLKKTFIHINLARKEFHKIWSDWWKTMIPPRLEVDMIPIFEDLIELNKVFMVGVEVKFFKDRKRNFYDGLQQVLAFSLFGFDSLVLWHIFSEELENKVIDEYITPVNEMVEGLNLPIVYFATKLTDDFKFEFFSPWNLYSSAKVDAAYLLTSMRDLCNKRRNPLLNQEEFEKRKKLLKLILKIPI